jgi:hypothetical protein
MKGKVHGVLAGLAAALLVAGPAHAASVSVRIEGDTRTLASATVATSGSSVGKPGDPTCAGNTALDALNAATGGNWDGPFYAGLGYAPESLLGEAHVFAAGSYWAFWLNDAYSAAGVCDVAVQEGDELLFFPDCATTGCTPVTPLRLGAVPATVRPGQAVAVRVEQLTAPVYPATETTAAPAAGATVTLGGVSATAGADGTATLTPAGSGPQTVQATKAGSVRSVARSTCVTTGSDGACGSSVPGAPGTPGGAAAPGGRDTTAPVARLAGLRKVYARGPRELRGTVSADPSGIRSVRLAVTRRAGGRCWAFSARRERFVRHRCGGWKSFRIGDRAAWSYLLPRRLPRGRYTIRVVAIDKAGNAGAQSKRIRVT